MWRIVMLAFAVAGCVRGRPAKSDAAVPDVEVIVDSYFPDAAPPPFDAAPLRTMACGQDAGACMLPPSTCLDDRYLIYYTGGTCDHGTCQFTTNWLYCGAGCVNGGCQGGF